MVKPGALLLLLAVAASFRPSQSETFDISSCPIKYFGEEYTEIEVVTDSATSTVCFLDSKSEHTGDCISLLGVITHSIKKTDRTDSVSLQSTVGTDIMSDCQTMLTFSSSNLEMIITLYRADMYAAVKLSSPSDATSFPAAADVIASAAGTEISTMNVPSFDLAAGKFLDLSGCRDSGHAFSSGQTHRQELCSQADCNVETGDVTLTSECVANQRCQDGLCHTIRDVCTVTGSSIIDFHEFNTKVPDRCAYTLLKPSSGNMYELVAVFKERRRQDVVFLDHLILVVLGTTIRMGQGGQVQINDFNTKLTDQFVSQHNVEIRKVQDEIQVKISDTSIEIHFNGYSAHVTASTDADTEGLCGDPSNSVYNPALSDYKSSHSDPLCSSPVTDTNTDPDCMVVTPHCELLNEAPFDVCNSHFVTTSYITACKDVLCHYPDGDGHKCQFFDAYAKACKLVFGITLDLSLVAGCSNEPHPCHDQYCSEDEFCGDRTDGTRCYCRALFAAKYPNNLGPSPECKLHSATLSLPNCLLEDRGIDHTTLQLNEESCTGDFDTVTHLVSFNFDDSVNLCGMENVENGNEKTYKNAVKTPDYSNDVIFRHDNVVIDFSCHYTIPVHSQVTLTIKESTVTQTITAGEFSYTLMMSAYGDSNHAHLIDENTQLHLNDKIYVELTSTGIDATELALYTKSCSAKSDEAQQGESSHTLINNGCGDDSTVDVVGNGVGTSNSFSFNLFQFTGKTGKIILECEVELCVIASGTCSKDCAQKRRKRRSFRSKYDRNSALISMSWES